MKRFIVFLSFYCSLCSCGKLDETVYSAIYTDNFYKTASDCEKAIISAYDPLADMYYGSAVTLASDLSADQCYPRAVVGRNTLTLFTYDPNYTTQITAGRLNECPQQIWVSCYEGMERTNWIIEKVPGANMNENRKKQIIGEAYFLRAFYLWIATKNFGEIPVKTRPSVSEAEAIIGKSPISEVYKQIYSDLDQALTAGLLSYPAVDKGRPSKEAVSALYSKVALYNQDWPTALQKAKDVINSNKYALMTDVRDVYRLSKEDAARSENIFAYETDATAPGRTQQLTALYGPVGKAPEYGRTTFGSIFAYPAFFDSFNPNDKRRTLLDTNYINSAGQVVAQKNITPVTTKGVLIKKYQNPNATGVDDVNILILRLADIYLIAAEAEFMQNGSSAAALGFINPVRRRAFGVSLTVPSIYDLSSLTLDVILQERSWELFAEGDRWYDLTRTGRFLTVIPNAVNDVYPVRTLQPKHRYFPIPLDEINANPKIKQNPDWD